MPLSADVAVYNPSGQITLIVEIKARTKTSRSWATRMRRNMLAHGVMPASPLLMLALPDRFYLWKNAGDTPELVEPTYEIDATPFLRPYYEKARILPDNLNEQSFELIVTAWLNELIRAGVSVEVPEEQKQMLQQSGLLESLKGGSVAVEALV